jgi:cytochrome c peroxidase
LGLILVNADGFDTQKGFVLRSVQNLQALGNSSMRPDATLAADFTGNGRNPDPPERLGWGNDGPPLRDFAMVAIVQHAPRRLARVANVDFRLPTDEELDALAAYQLALGRQEDFNLPLLQLTSTIATTGKKLYLDTGNLGEPGRKNCNACHFNGGGTGAFALNPQKPGFPRLDGNRHGANIAAPTNVNDLPIASALRLPRDGGFGQIFLPLFGSFGNDDDIVPFGHLQAEEFNSGPTVESADTGPFFHNHTVKTLEEAVAFYGTPAFQAGLFSKFGLITVQISPNPEDPEVQAIATFLRVLNALENIRSSINIAERGRQVINVEEARELAGLALTEVVDAIQVLSEGALAKSSEPPILSARAHLLQARANLEAARQALASTAIANVLSAATGSLRTARSALADPATLPVSFRN